MTGGAATVPFRAAYASALAAYLDDPGERPLRVAYELGREAVTRGLSVLDLATAHQDALLTALAGTPGASEKQDLAAAAGDFLLESLSSFDMVQLGFREAREAAAHERRRSEMSRQLSTFLADASLALDASDSLEEMLRLVSEQARDLVDADCCLATLAAGDCPRATEAVSCTDARRWRGFLQWLDLFAVYRLIRLNGGAVRMHGDELAGVPPIRIASRGRPPRGWLAASLTALDGSELGAIQLFDRQDGGFNESDEAVVVHLAQMASAAVERARLYQP